MPYLINECVSTVYSRTTPAHCCLQMPSLSHAETLLSSYPDWLGCDPSINTGIRYQEFTTRENATARATTTPDGKYREHWGDVISHKSDITTSQKTGERETYKDRNNGSHDDDKDQKRRLGEQICRAREDAAKQYLETNTKHGQPWVSEVTCRQLKGPEQSTWVSNST